MYICVIDKISLLFQYPSILGKELWDEALFFRQPSAAWLDEDGKGWRKWLGDGFRVTNAKK